MFTVREDLIAQKKWIIQGKTTYLKREEHEKDNNLYKNNLLKTIAHFKIKEKFDANASYVAIYCKPTEKKKNITFNICLKKKSDIWTFTPYFFFEMVSLFVLYGEYFCV